MWYLTGLAYTSPDPMDRTFPLGVIGRLCSVIVALPAHNCFFTILLSSNCYLTCKFVARVPRPAIPMQQSPGSKSHGISTNINATYSIHV